MPVILGDTSITSSNGTLTTPDTFTLSSGSLPLRVNSSYIKNTKPITYNSDGTPARWNRIGRISGATGQGSCAVITFQASFGFNATQAQVGRSVIELYGSNNNTSNYNISGRFWHEGHINSQRFVRNVKLKSVNNQIRDNEYDIWVESIWYSPNTMVDIQVGNGWEFTWASDYGTLTSSPGAESSTIKDLPYSRGMGMVAMINFAGDTLGVTENSGFASVSRMSSGNYELLFLYPQIDANYAVTITTSFDTGVSGGVIVSLFGDGSPPNSSGFRFRVSNESDFYHVAVFRSY
jgi:hypothetical protein